MKTFLKFLSLIAIAIVSFITVGCIDLSRPHHPQNEEIAVEEYEEEQITPEQAAENMCVVRKQCAWDHACDSVFLVMPERIIVYITLHNPDFGTWDIGNEYLLKKEIYDKLNEDVKLLDKYKEQQTKKSVEPDTIPTKTKPDKQTVLPEEV